MNFSILMDVLSLFRKGNEVANPEAWKDGGNAATLLVPVLIGAVKLAGDFGYGIELDTETAVAIAGGIVSIVHFIVLNVSSKRAGVLPAATTDLQPLDIAEAKRQAAAEAYRQ